MPKKPIMVDEALHALWKADAAREGRSLTEYVTRAVEAVRKGEVVRRAGSRVAPVTMMGVNPKDCTNRLRAGSYCRICGATHVKGSAA